MPTPLPWFPFHVDAWEFDEAVRLMDWEARGVYIGLLCWQWREGSVPSDAKRLASVMRAPVAVVRLVLARGFKDDGTNVGRMINAKMAEIRIHQLQKSGKASHSARGWKSTEERYLYAATTTTGNAYDNIEKTRDLIIKIGWSRNPKSRVAAIGRESQRTLKLIGMRVATIALERKAHVDLALHKIQGEWFRDVPAVRQWLETNGVTGNTAGTTSGDTDGTTAVRRRIRSEIEKSLSASANNNDKSEAA